ncbi:MAG TPA: hypothetical protein DD624_07055 [Alphaproteobacteria bacterium]|nr:hypothetical protein [Alphaproteobacteria bacterium]
MTENTEKQIVDTLFGKQEEQLSPGFDYADELPHVLFGSDSQAVLPLIQVPLYAPTIVEQDKIAALIPYLDELSLFEKRWGCTLKDEESRDEWCERVNTDLIPVLNDVRAVCERENILRPRAAYVYMQAKADGDSVDFYKADGKTVAATINFKRRADGVSLADKFSPETFSTVAVAAVTMGKNAGDVAKKWLLLGQDAEYGCLDGFVREMVRAMAEYTAEKINRDGCCTGNVYPLDAEEGKTVSALAREAAADKVGITYGANHMLAPQYSALALVLPN